MCGTVYQTREKNREQERERGNMGRPTTERGIEKDSTNQEREMEGAKERERERGNMGVDSCC